MELPLRVLWSSPGSSSPIFLPLFDPRITCEKSGFFQSILKIGIVLKKGFCNPMADGNRLPGLPSPMNINGHIELISSSCNIQGLKDDHFARFSPEILLQSPFVDNKLPFSGFKPNPCDGGFSFACSINRFCHFLLSSFTPPSPSPLEGEGWEGGTICKYYFGSSGIGFCDSCG
jgi:hypothetical protein